MPFTNPLISGERFARISGLESDNWSDASNTGWRITAAGDATFNNVNIRADLQSSNYPAGGWKLSQDGTAIFKNISIQQDIQSSTYTTSAGWILRQDGSAELRNVNIRNTIQSDTFTTSNGWRLLQNGSAEFRNVNIRNTIQSDTFTTNNGWRLLQDGSAEFRNVTITNDIASSTYGSSAGWKLPQNGRATFPGYNLAEISSLGSTISTTFHRSKDWYPCSIDPDGEGHFTEYSSLSFPRMRLLNGIVYFEGVLNCDTYTWINGTTPRRAVGWPALPAGQLAATVLYPERDQVFVCQSSGTNTFALRITGSNIQIFRYSGSSGVNVWLPFSVSWPSVDLNR